MRDLWRIASLPRVLSLTFGGLAMAALLAPVLAAHSRVEAVALYAAFSPFCHQNVERCWHLLGEPLALCVRCLGFYWGAAMAGIFIAFASRRTFAAALTLCTASWALEAAGILSMPSLVRFGVGAGLGLSALQVAISSLDGRERTSSDLLP